MHGVCVCVVLAGVCETATNCSRLSGSLPTELGGLYKSYEMVVRDMPLLSGSLPTQLGRLPSTLEMLELSHLDRISGTLPRAIGGPCHWPADIKNGVNALAVNLAASHTHACHIVSRLSLSAIPQLSGTLPDVRGWRMGVAQLSLTGPTLLSGTLPSAISLLHRVDFSGNRHLSG